MKPAIIETYENAKQISDFLYKKLIEDIARKNIVLTERTCEEVLSKNSDFFDMWRKSRSVCFDIGSKVQGYSEVPVYLVRSAFSVLLTYVEGEKFVPYSNWESDLRTFAVIVRETAQDSITNNKELEQACEKGDAVILDCYNCSTVSFYDAECNASFNVGKYKYVQDFIDYIVSRNSYEKSCDKDIGDKCLEKYLVQFLKNYGEDLLESNKDKRKVLLKETIPCVSANDIVEKCKRIDRKVK